MVWIIAIEQSHFNIRHFFALIVCYILPIDKTLSGATIPGQSRPGSIGNEGIHRKWNWLSKFKSLRLESSHHIVYYEIKDIRLEGL